MSMMTVPSLAPGARTLPGELRVPHGEAYGWHRLHQNLAPLTEPPTHLIPVDPRITLSGLGDCVDDMGNSVPCATDGGGYVDPATLQNVIDQLPVGPSGLYGPVTIYTQDSGGNTTSQSMTPAQLTALINAGSSSLQRVLAITQGGSVLANGSIIGSQQAAALAANQAALNVSTAGLSGVLSNPIVLIGGLAVIALVLSRK